MDKQKQPQLLNCLIATAVGFVLSVIIVIVLLYAIRPMLVLPATLGLIKPLLPEDVMRAPIPGTTQLELGESRHYFIFTQRRVIVGDYRLRLVSVATGMPVELRAEVRPIEYDTDAVQGLLLYNFAIDEPGLYELSVEEAPVAETLLIAPNFTGRNQLVVILFFTLLLLLFGLGAWLYWRRGQRPDAVVVQSKRDRWDAWVDEDNQE